MNNRNDSRKQSIMVLLFFIFIICSIVGVVLTHGGIKTDEDDIVSNNNDEIVEENTTNDVVEDSEPIKVITSNPNASKNTSNKTNNKTSNKNNSSTSNKNSGNTSNTTNNYIPVSYFITEVDSNKIYVGSKTKINVTIKPDNATNKKVIYSSSNTSVARVSSDGTITGVGVGTTNILIKVEEGGQAQVAIQVVAKPPTNIAVSSVSVSPSTVTVAVGGQAMLSPTISPSNATNKNVSWSSSNTSVATVSSSGIITGKKEGTATITVTTKDGNKKDTAKVTVVKKTIPVTGVTLNKSSVSLKVGGNTTLTATITPSNATNKGVVWSSNNTKVATVSNGKITAVSAGTATITVRTSDGSKTATCKVTVTAIKNGWVTENGNRYYYENDKKVTNAYREYIYLDSSGVAQPKIGSFSATLYGAQAWANQDLNIRQQANKNSTKLGTVPVGKKMTILSAENTSTKYIKIKYGNITGYVYSEYIFINLPDVMPDVIYEISNANASIFKTAGYSIPNVTGVNLYKFSKAYNNKIGKTTYYAPLLYPVAKKFQNAYNSAKVAGYNFKVYDTYRPRPVEELVTQKYKALYNSNATVKNKVNYDADGVYWGYTWFMTATGTSRHCQAIALDLTLTDSRGNELTMQSKIHTLDTSSLRKYNNANANKLSGFMTNAGFSTLKSEWWHFEDNTYKNNAYNTFYIS